MRLIVPLILSLFLAGCAAGSAVVGGAVGVTSLAVKGTVGAGKLAYRGTKAVVVGTAEMVRKDEVPGERATGPAPDIADDFANLPDADD